MRWVLWGEEFGSNWAEGEILLKIYSRSPRKREREKEEGKEEEKEEGKEGEMEGGFSIFLSGDIAAFVWPLSRFSAASKWFLQSQNLRERRFKTLETLVTFQTFDLLFLKVYFLESLIFKSCIFALLASNPCQDWGQTYLGNARILRTYSSATLFLWC